MRFDNCGSCCQVALSSLFHNCSIGLRSGGKLKSPALSRNQSCTIDPRGSFFFWKMPSPLGLITLIEWTWSGTILCWLYTCKWLRKFINCNENLQVSSACDVQELASKHVSSANSNVGAGHQSSCKCLHEYKPLLFPCKLLRNITRPTEECLDFKLCEFQIANRMYIYLVHLQ